MFRPAWGNFAQPAIFDGQLPVVRSGVHQLCQQLFCRREPGRAEPDGREPGWRRFNRALVQGANFDGTTGITAGQIVSTASYMAHDLSQTNFSRLDLSSINLSGQNLLTRQFFFCATQKCQPQPGELDLFVFERSRFDRCEFAAGKSYRRLLRWRHAQGGRFDRREHSKAAQFTTYTTGPINKPTITLAQLYSTASYQAHDLTGIGLGGNDLSGGNFTGQNLSGAWLAVGNFSGANFHQANLSQAYLADSNFIKADFSAANLNQADFSYAQLAGANLQSADLRSASLFADLTGADFTGPQRSNRPRSPTTRP